jgi:hypothetical protein
MFVFLKAKPLPKTYEKEGNGGGYGGVGRPIVYKF